MSASGTQIIPLRMTSEMSFFFFFPFLVFKWLDIISCSEIQVTDAKLLHQILYCRLQYKNYSVIR